MGNQSEDQTYTRERNELFDGTSPIIWTQTFNSNDSLDSSYETQFVNGPTITVTYSSYSSHYNICLKYNNNKIYITDYEYKKSVKFFQDNLEICLLDMAL